MPESIFTSKHDSTVLKNAASMLESATRMVRILAARQDILTAAQIATLESNIYANIDAAVARLK